MSFAALAPELSPVLRAAKRDRSVALRDLLQGGSDITVVAPHPDDETLGCGALLAEASRAGVASRVICMTDGSASHRGSATWSAERIAAARRLELDQAVGILAPGASVLHMGFRDCGLPVAGTAFRSAVRRLSGHVPTGSLVLAAWGGDPHVDHERAAKIVRRMVEDRGDLRVMWYPVWGRFSEVEPEGRVSRVRAPEWARQTKRRALACHRTQMTRLIDDDPTGFVMEDRHQAHFLGHEEIFIAG
jgi:LmbE family N-acetylglucosaminyl deacetylase